MCWNNRQKVIANDGGGEGKNIGSKMVAKIQGIVRK